jgi:ATP-dependent exoDNAse (exonuclease V) beta subunit
VGILSKIHHGQGGKFISALQPGSPPRLRLIEASAGTGKAYTIAVLYLRLVLGHGGENSFLRPLIPQEILVVTFTKELFL